MTRRGSPGGGETVIVEAGVRHVSQLRLRQPNRCAGVWRHLDRQLERALLQRPRRADGAVHGLVARAGAGEAPAGLRLDADVLVAGHRRVDFEACHHAVHPVAYRAVGVMVERVHAAILERAVRLPAIPSLPDLVAPCFTGYNQEG